MCYYNMVCPKIIQHEIYHTKYFSMKYSQFRVCDACIAAEIAIKVLSWLSAWVDIHQIHRKIYLLNRLN